VFTDDDCTVAPDWLQTLEIQFKKTPDCLIGDRTINAVPNNIYSTASQELINYLYSYYNAIDNRAKFFTSNNFALPTNSFQKIGGFDTSFFLAAGEDREFCDRWLHLRIIFSFSSGNCNWIILGKKQKIQILKVFSKISLLFYLTTPTRAPTPTFRIYRFCNPIPFIPSLNRF